MRYVPVVAASLLCVVLCASAPSAVKAPAGNPTVPPIMSADGLEGLREVFVDPQVVGNAQWTKAVKYDQKQLRAEVEARLRRVSGLRLVSDRAANAPRLLVMVQGHTIPGFSSEDPPAATHITVTLLQPVILLRRGPAGQPIITSAGCDERSAFNTSKASAMRERVKGKVAAMIGEFAADYGKANPKAR